MADAATRCVARFHRLGRLEVGGDDDREQPVIIVDPEICDWCICLRRDNGRDGEEGWPASWLFGLAFFDSEEWHIVCWSPTFYEPWRKGYSDLCQQLTGYTLEELAAL